MDSKELQDFIEGLYDENENGLRDTYRQKKESRDELLKAIAIIMLSYNIVDGVMSISRKDFFKESNNIKKLIKSITQGDITQMQDNTNNILKNTVESVFDFYSYNHDLKDVEKIIKDGFKGKHFSDRIWDNEQAVANRLNKQCQDFLQGKINVNQIKNDIEKTYNTSAYNAKRLVETEVSRCSNQSFIRFCNETGVEKVRYNSVLDANTCNDCSQYNGRIYDLDKALELPRHPLCRCYYEIADYEKIHKISGNKEINNNKNVMEDKISVDKCAEKIKDLGVNNVNLRHIKNGEVLKPFVDELENLKNEYGQIFNSVESIDLTENTIAQLNGRVLQLNQRYFNDAELLQNQLNDWAKFKYIPMNCNNIKYVATHEYMHLLTQDEIDNSTSIINKICSVAKKEDIISINSRKDRYEFVADLLAANKINGFKNRTVKKLLKVINGGG